MNTSNHITVDQCCFYYKIETTFVQSLNEHGLIELTKSEKEYSISYEQLANLEKYIHLHYDLDINMEGMEAITHLLTRVYDLQNEVKKLQNELGQG